MSLFQRPQPRPVAATKPKYKRASRQEMLDRAKARVEVEKSRLALQRMREEEEYLAYLREHDRERYNELMERRMGLNRPDEEEDPIERFVAMREALQRLGLEGGNAGGGGLQGIIGDVLKNGPALLAQWQALQSPGHPPTPQPLPPLAAQPRATTRPPAQPAAQPPAPVPAAPPAQPATPPADSMEGRFLRGLAEAKGPTGLAAWLTSNDDARAQEIAGAVAQLPDDRLPALWQQIAAQAPGLASFCAWLPTWSGYGEAIAAVRTMHVQRAGANGQADAAAMVM